MVSLKGRNSTGRDNTAAHIAEDAVDRTVSTCGTNHCFGHIREFGGGIQCRPLIEVASQDDKGITESLFDMDNEIFQVLKAGSPPRDCVVRREVSGQHHQFSASAFDGPNNRQYLIALRVRVVNEFK